jgi:glycosyltransferase involved in cell wall biosynthesis
MRILTISSLFPRATAPHHGVFVFQRMEAVARAGAEVRVVAPLPWVPPGPVPRSYASVRSVPATDQIGSLAVNYPRYFMLPKLGMRGQARSYSGAVRRALTAVLRQFTPDLLDVHYLYPDACGVALAARRVGIPYVCSARGSDVKLVARIPWARERIRQALAGAAGVIAVSHDLAEEMRGLDLCRGTVRVIPNGIDPEKFYRRNRDEARRELGLPLGGRIAVSVANLVSEHGQRTLVRAMARPEAPRDLTLLLVGDGPDADALRRLVTDLGLEQRVRLVGPQPHARVPLWFSAADFSVLLSDREGCPNVVLESLACGVPCLASDLPEMQEVIRDPSEGLLVSRSERDLARAFAGMNERASRPLDREPRTWRDVASEVLEYLAEVLDTQARRGYGEAVAGRMSRAGIRD